MGDMYPWHLLFLQQRKKKKHEGTLGVRSISVGYKATRFIARVRPNSTTLTQAEH